MSFLVSPAAVWDAMTHCGMKEEAAEFARAMESALQEGANKLAAKLGVVAGVATMDHDAFAGLLVAMSPAHDGQALPDALEGADEDSEWGEES